MHLFFSWTVVSFQDTVVAGSCEARKGSLAVACGFTAKANFVGLRNKAGFAGASDKARKDSHANKSFM